MFKGKTMDLENTDYQKKLDFFIRNLEEAISGIEACGYCSELGNRLNSDVRWHAIQKNLSVIRQTSDTSFGSRKLEIETKQ